MFRRPPVFFAALFIFLFAARLCHSGTLWAEETLPLAAALQMLAGKVLYRDVWFDKPPLLPTTYLLWAAQTGWVLRVAGALYGLLASWLAYRLASHWWSRREGFMAAALMAFFLVFWIHSAVTPLAADLLMLAPHLAAVLLAVKGRFFWSGLVAGIAFQVNVKGLFVLAACLLWSPQGLAMVGAGFIAANAAVLGTLAATGALTDYVEQVWVWPRVYALNPIDQHPIGNAALRSANWLGFHAAAVIGALRFAADRGSPRRRMVGWALLSLAAVTLGWRFFPRYFFQLLPVLVLCASRGLVLLGRRGIFVLLLLLIPMVRFGPRYVTLAAESLRRQPHSWRDLAMDRDSRRAAAVVREAAAKGDTLFVWGFRPELFAYTGLPAGARFLDSQPLTGVPADRHLTQSDAVDLPGRAAHLQELARSRPTWVLDGLGPYNPSLAIRASPELASWMRHYREAARTDTVIIYRLIP